MSPAPARLAALAAAAGLLAAACGGSSGAASAGRSSGGGSTAVVSGGARPVAVTLTPAGCAPARIEVAAGPVTFEVVNTGADAISEFEIVKDGKIVGEVENVSSGLRGEFSLRLDAGTYETRCPGGTSAATGTLVVRGSAVAPNEAAGDVADAYRAYVVGRADELVRLTDAFTAAIDHGDVAEAKRLYAPARQPYEAIEPVAESFGDLDPAIDARDGDLPKGTPWTGFHRVERALWETRSLNGMRPIAAQLRRDVRRLAQLVRTEPLQPAQIANGAAELLNEVGTSKITGEEDRYSHTDLWDFDANVDGSRAAIATLRPLLVKRDGALATTIDDQFAAVDAALAKHRSGDGFATYASLTPADTRALASVVDALAESVSKVAPLVNE